MFIFKNTLKKSIKQISTVLFFSFYWYCLNVTELMYNLSVDNQSVENTDNIYMYTAGMDTKLAVNVYGEKVSDKDKNAIVVTVSMNELLIRKNSSYVNFLTNTTNDLYDVLMASQQVRKMLSTKNQDKDVQNLLECLPFYFKRNPVDNNEVRMQTCVQEYKNRFKRLVDSNLWQYTSNSFFYIVVTFILFLLMHIKKIRSSFLFYAIGGFEGIKGFIVLHASYKWYTLKRADKQLSWQYRLSS